MRRLLTAGLLVALVVAGIVAAGAGEKPASPAPGRQIEKGKETVLGLYVTAREAYEKWKAKSEKVKILDVRTTEEYLFVGHPAMAYSVPLYLQTYQWDADKRRLPMKPNPDFVSQVKKIARPTDTILLICRSGGRSAQAADRLAEAGFQRVYSVIDGMEGDVVDDPGSVFQGQRMKNGWKNSGLPWTYDLDPGRMQLPRDR